MRDDEAWMGVALEEADRAASLGEVPVGCLVVGADGSEIGRAGNARESLQDPTAHAEILALRAASSKIGSWRLEGATAYVTLEPCAMCAGALVLARVSRVVFGCEDPKAGAVTTMFGVGVDTPPEPSLRGGERCMRADECAARLRAFVRPPASGYAVCTAPCSLAGHCVGGSASPGSGVVVVANVRCLDARPGGHRSSSGRTLPAVPELDGLLHAGLELGIGDEASLARDSHQRAQGTEPRVGERGAVVGEPESQRRREDRRQEEGLGQVVQLPPGCGREVVVRSRAGIAADGRARTRRR